MKFSRENLKKISTTLVLFSFLSFTSVVNAQTTDGSTIDLSGCATEVVSSYLAGSLASFGGSTVAGVAPRTTEGVVIEGAVGAQAAAPAADLATAISVPVNDIAANVKLTIGNTVSTANASFHSTTKMNLDALSYSIAQCMLTQITDNTVKWISGGFQGSGPKFAVDTTKLFQDLSDAVLEDFSNQIKNIKACDFTPNFVMDLANSVETSAPKRSKFPAKIQCPFNTVNISAQDVYNDFSVLGWRGFEMMLDDRGNQFGVSMLTAQEAQRRQQEAKQKEDQKLSWSSGFADIIDTENCHWPSNVRLGTVNTENGPMPTIAFMLPNGSPDGSVEVLTPERKRYYEKEFCETTTPGKIVGDSLMKAIGAKQDRIGFADNMNKIVSALVHELTKEAVTGLFKAGNNATPASGAQSNTGPATGGVGPSAQAPYVSTASASSVTPTSATLNGSIAYSTISGTAWFEWSTSDVSLLQPGQANETARYTYLPGLSTGFSSILSGLTPGSTYYYRAVGQTAQGRWYSVPRSFTTTP